MTPISILAATLDRVSRQLEALQPLDPDVEAELRAACQLARGLDPYLSACTTPESSALRRLAERTRAEDWSGRPGSDPVVHLEQEMLSGHVEGQLLKMLVHLSRATRVLDLGMFTGYSALAMAEALPDHGEVVACEIDPRAAGIAQSVLRRLPPRPQDHRARRAGSVDAHAAVRRRRDVRPGLPRRRQAQSYWAYLTVLLDTGLLAPGAVVCVDNTLMQGQPYASGAATPNGRAIAAFNRAVAEDSRLEQVLLPLRDGLTLIRRVERS